MLDSFVKFFHILLFFPQFFRDELRKRLRTGSRFLDRMFPELDDLFKIHMSFLESLQDLQSRRPDRQIDEIGPVLKKQVTDRVFYWLENLKLYVKL